MERNWHRLATTSTLRTYATTYACHVWWVEHGCAVLSLGDPQIAGLSCIKVYWFAAHGRAVGPEETADIPGGGELVLS